MNLWTLLVVITSCVGIGTPACPQRTETIVVPNLAEATCRARGSAYEKLPSLYEGNGRLAVKWSCVPQ